MKTISAILLTCALMPAITFTSCKRTPEPEKATQPTPDVSQEFGTSVKGSVATGDSDPGHPGSGITPPPEKTPDAQKAPSGNTGSPVSGNAEAGNPGSQKADSPGTGSQAPPHEVPGR